MCPVAIEPIQSPADIPLLLVASHNARRAGTRRPMSLQIFGEVFAYVTIF